MQRNTKANRSSARKTIARQIARMSDAELYALTDSADRETRRLAMDAAHKRAEDFATRH